MSRLKYNNFKATLGGSGLTTSGTTITFASPPTYGNNQALPAVSSPDYMALTVCDSTFSTFEIVWMTAYAGGGALTGTILRAQENTLGIAHNSGDRILHSATVQDYTPYAAAGVAPTLRTTQTGNLQSAGSNVTVTVPAGVQTTDYIFLTYGFTNPGSLPTGFTLLGTASFTSFYGSGVWVYYRTGLQAGDTFTAVKPSANNSSYSVHYMKDVQTVGSPWTQGLSDSTSMGTVPAASPGLAAHQTEVAFFGFTADPGGSPTFSSGTSSGFSSTASGAGPNAQSEAVVSTTGSSITVTQAAGHTAGSAVAVVLTGTPSTPLAQTFFEQTAASVATPSLTSDNIYIDSADHQLKRKDSTGAVTNVERAGGLADYLNSNFI